MSEKYEILEKRVYFPLEGKSYTDSRIETKELGIYSFCNNGPFNPERCHVRSYSDNSLIVEGYNYIFDEMWIGNNISPTIYFYKNAYNQMDSIAFEDGGDYTNVSFCAANRYQSSAQHDEPRPLALAGDSMVSPWPAIPVYITTSIRYSEGEKTWIPGVTFAHKYNVSSDEGFRFAAYLPSALTSLTIGAGDSNVRNKICVVNDDLADENNILDVYFSPKSAETYTLPQVSFADTTGLTNNIKIRFNFFEGYEDYFSDFVDGLKEDYPDWNIVDPYFIPRKKNTRVNWLIDDAVSKMTFSESLSESEIEDCFDAPKLEFVINTIETQQEWDGQGELPEPEIYQQVWAYVSASNGVPYEGEALIKITDLDTGEIQYAYIEGDGRGPEYTQGKYVAVTIIDGNTTIASELGDISEEISITWTGEKNGYDFVVNELFVSYKGTTISTNEVECSNSHTK